MEVKSHINKVVIHHPSGVRYRLTAYIYRQDARGKPLYQAELQDLTALRSVRVCKLSDIETGKG